MSDNNNQKAVKEMTPAEAVAKGESFRGLKASPAGKQFPLRGDGTMSHGNERVAKPVDSIKLNPAEHFCFAPDGATDTRFQDIGEVHANKGTRRSGTTDSVGDVARASVDKATSGSPRAPMGQFPLRGNRT